MVTILRSVAPIVVLTLATLLGGCVAYPAYNSGYYAAPAPYYVGPTIAVGGGWGRGHHRGW